MSSARGRATTSAIRDGIRIEDLGSEVVALDPAGGRVHRLTGAAAAAVRGVLAGRAPSPEVSQALADTGILRSGRASSPPAGVHLSPSRRAVVAAATLGITTLLLPSADASASPGALAAGSTGYLTVTGVGNSSLAAPGSLQFVSFTATSGDRHVTPNEPLQVEVLLVGGGGGGAYGGGGGGGGAVTRQILTLDGGQRYDVVVGSGGAGSAVADPGVSGAASTFSRNGTPSVELLRAAGGGGGAYANGDGGDSTFPGGDGSGTSYAEDHASGGGGGAAGLGESAVGGDGGDGGGGALVTDFVGDPETYGGGGGGGGYLTAGAGGAGGGGAGGSGTSVAGTPGTAGSGGGGGGGSPYGDGGAGGSGLVMIRYYGAQPAVSVGLPMM